MCSWFHLIRPRCVSRLLVDKITCLLTTEWTFIHQVLEVPSGAADLPGFENPPIVWLQLTLYHSSLSPHSPGVLVLSTSASFGSFLLCLFDLTCLHLLYLSSLLVLHCVPASSLCFCCSFFTAPSGSISSPEEPFLPACFLFFPKILYPVKPFLPTVPSTWVSVYSFPHKKPSFSHLWKTELFLQCPEN